MSSTSRGLPAVSSGTGAHGEVTARAVRCMHREHTNHTVSDGEMSGLKRDLRGDGETVGIGAGRTDGVGDGNLPYTIGIIRH